jgi:predicted unusual protein kinase regulating ubiquinone biosynthesis (AarF/ABC1/UbiB family)
MLTLQYIEGTKITDYEALERQGIIRGRVAEILMGAYLKQVLEDGFFHADPHPGNLFVRPGPVLVLLDFGMVGDISPQTRDNIMRVFLGIVRRDFDDVLSALARLGFLLPAADRQALKRSLVWAVDSFYELSFGELRDVNPLDVLDQLQDVFYAQDFQIPANFAFLGRALGTLSGLCTALDPSFRFVSVAEPYARVQIRLQRRQWGLTGSVAREARRLGTATYSLPFLARDVLQMVDEGAFDFQPQINDITRFVLLIERILRRLIYALLVAGFLIAGAFLSPQHDFHFVIPLLVVAALYLLLVMLPIRRRR